MQCSGCGVSLQTKDPQRVGYTPMSSLGRERVVCKRCYRIRNYGEVSTIEQSEEDYVSFLHELKEKKGLVVQIVDLFDLKGSMIPNNKQFVSGKSLLLVGNKIDLFPRSVKREHIKQYVRDFVLKKGLKPVDVVLCSADKGENMDYVLKVMNSYREGDDVYVIGTTNVGKSTFINQLVSRLSNEKYTVTTSPYPGTTLHPVRVSFSRGKQIIDTPGYVRKDRLHNLLSPSELKIAMPKKEIRPRVYQLESEQTVFIGGLVRMDFVDGDKQPFIFYVSNELYVHRTKQSNADAFFKVHVGEILIPPENDKKVFPWEKHVFHLDGNEKEDIVISSLGWIACGRKEATVNIYAPEGVSVGKRLALV